MQMFISVQTVAPKAPVSLLLKPPKTPVMPLPSSTATTGRDARSKSGRIDLPGHQEVAASEVVVALEAVCVEDLAPEVASVAVVALEVGMVDVGASEAVATVDLLQVVSTTLLLPPLVPHHRTPSPTLPLLEENPASLSTFAT